MGSGFSVEAETETTWVEGEEAVDGVVDGAFFVVVAVGGRGETGAGMGGCAGMVVIGCGSMGDEGRVDDIWGGKAGRVGKEGLGLGWEGGRVRRRPV